MERTILLVEDESIIALDRSQRLRRSGYEVIVAYTGQAAVKMVDSSDKIDLVLMDIDLGKKSIDGTEAAAQILAGHDLPAVFLSNHVEPEIVEKTEKITSYGYVVKNSGDTVLNASIKMAFKLHAANLALESREKRLSHLNRVLLSTRNINQIITKDPARDDLLNNTCRLLIETTGQMQDWIIMM
jgi:CheY-like chemotaxis protein